MNLKLTSAIILFIVLGFTHYLAAQIIVYNQRYQVENMPLPKPVTFYNSIAAPSEHLSTIGRDDNYQRNYHRLTGTVPITNKDGLIISVGIGYATDQLKLDNPLIKKKNHALWTQMYTTGSIGELYYWRGIYAFGSYSDNFKLKNSATYKHTLLAQFGRKWNDNLATSIGISFLSNFNDPLYVPIVHISYSKGPWVIDALLPQDVSLRYLATEKIHLLLINSIIRRSYYNFDINQSNRYSINEFGVQAEFNIIGAFWCELSVTKPYGMKIETQLNDNYNEIGNVNQSLSINGGLFVRIKGI